MTCRRLPPFSALRGFEAAARHLSFKRAAEELCLTQSAVSHQVKVLEDFLGKPLFTRAPIGVTLTRAGQDYFDEMAPIFDALARATQSILSEDDQPALSLRCSPGFANRWLMPRLADARRHLPGVEISLTMAPSSMEDVDPSDVRINCGYEVPPGWCTDVFMTTRRAPVCSPGFLAAHGPVRTLDELLRLPLLRERAGDEWDNWLALHAGGRSPTGLSAVLDDGYASLSAAEAGLGVALGHLTLVQREIYDGGLVQIHEGLTNESVIYTLTSPPGWEKNQRIVAFRDWLIAQTKQDVDGLSPLKLAVSS